MTKQTRRVFTEEFKLKAVRLVENSGCTIAQVGDEIDFHTAKYTVRLRADEGDQSIAFPIIFCVVMVPFLFFTTSLSIFRAILLSAILVLPLFINFTILARGKKTRLDQMRLE